MTIATTYVRWMKGESRRCALFNPFKAGHPMVESECLICRDELGVVEPIRLVAIGPEDVDDFHKWEQGRWFTCAAIAVHEDCLKPFSEDELERRINAWLEFSSIDRTLDGG